MTEEEKKLVSQIKDVAQYKTIVRYGDGHDTIAWIPRPEQTMVLNNYTAKVLYDLIEKKQNKIASQEKQIKLMQSCDLAKEIRNLQEEIEERETRLQEEINENCKLKAELYGNSINKDKIRDKIKELEKQKINYFNMGWHSKVEIIRYRIEELRELLKEG